MIALRDYQRDAVAGISSALRASPRAAVCLALPTGGGKTIIMGAMARAFARRGKAVAIVAHRRNLVAQLQSAIGGYDKINIVGVQSFANKPSAAHAILIDEAHHAIATTYRKAITASGAKVVIGVSATPERADGRGMGEVFDAIVQGKQMAELINDGWLAKYRYFAPARMIDPLADKPAATKEFTRKQQDGAANIKRRWGDAVLLYQKHLAGRRAIVFGYNVADAKNLAASFTAAGINAAAVSGNMPPAAVADAIDGFRAGSIAVLTSCDLISEGFDVPEAAGVIMARATQSTTIFLQQCGRCLRAKAGGEAAVIIDMVGNALRHGLPDDLRQWDLAGAAARRKPTAETITWRRCPACFYACPRALPVCQECGHRFIAEVDIANKPNADFGELDAHSIARIRAIVKDKRAAQKRAAVVERKGAKTLAALQAVGKQLGYKPQWAYQVWQARNKRAA